MPNKAKHDKPAAEKPGVDPRSQAHRTPVMPPSGPPEPKDPADRPVEQPARPPAKQEIPTKDLLWPKEPG